MSNEHQNYSTENQRLAIRKYADQNGFVIVETYQDNARTGITLRSRDGLRQLLQDVTNHSVSFQAIIVYDTSRWGRFQDTDEAAHYEFLCRSAGIHVHYCAEPFSNDGTPTDTLLKTIKRTMAAEYSRELGVKVAAGQRNIFTRGFRGGGALPGYGLRRMLVAADGTPKQILRLGERKAVQSDRVILVPGPAEEVTWVREVFRLFIEEEYNYREIAELLNGNGVARANGRSWDVYAVRELLTNSKYNGWLTYGKWTRRLQTKPRKTPEAQWLRVRHPSAKLIDDATFLSARKRIKSFTINKADGELLDELRSLMATKERLSSDIIRRIPRATAPNVYRYRFGTVRNALELIGYTHPETKQIVTRRRVQQLRSDLMQQLKEMFPKAISIRGRGGRTRNWLQLRTGAKISVRACIQPAGLKLSSGWLMHRAKSESRWIALVALLNRENTRVERLLIYRSVPDKTLYISSKSPWLELGVPLDELQRFCELVAMIRLAKPKLGIREQRANVSTVKRPYVAPTVLVLKKSITR